MSQRERLDVESEEERSARLGTLFGSISAPPPSEPAQPAFPTPSRPHAVPESDVLARARAFLPLLAAANDDLATRAETEDVSIEDPDSENIVSMDVQLGVFDVNGEVGDVGPVVERDASVWENADMGSESGSGSESESESDSSEEGSSEEEGSSGQSGNENEAHPRMVTEL